MLKKCEYCNARIRPTLERLHLKKCMPYRRALKAKPATKIIKDGVKIELVKTPPNIFGVGQELHLTDKGQSQGEEKAATKKSKK